MELTVESQVQESPVLKPLNKWHEDFNQFRVSIVLETSF